jgi:hypothetical protein
MWIQILAAALLLQTPPATPDNETAEAKKATPPVTLTVALNPTEVHLGDRAQLVITARHNQDVRVFFPAAPDLAPFRIVGKAAPPVQVIQDGQVVQRWTLSVAAMRLGRRKVPPIAIDYEGADGKTGQAATPALSVNVVPRFKPDEAQQEAGNDPPMALLGTNWMLVILLFGAAVIAITSALTWLAVRYVSALPRRGPPPPPPRPAHEIAYERLATLKATQLLQKGEFKEFTFELSEILREYLGRRLSTDTLELTTSELLDTMKRLAPQGLSVYTLESFLQNTDLVKFAKLVPTHDQAMGSLETCEQMIAATRQGDAEIRAMLLREEQRRLLEKPAHPFKRMQAFMTDLLMAAAVHAVLVLCSRWLETDWFLWADGVLLVAFVMFKDVYDQGSLGKVFCGIGLSPSEGTNPSEISVGSRVLRNLPWLLPIAGQTMEFIVMSYAADGRRVGDRWAGTRVLDLHPEFSDRAALLYSGGLFVALVVVAYFVPFVWAGA